MRLLIAAFLLIQVTFQCSNCLAVNQTIEAETSLASDSKTEPNDQASGGQFASNLKDWQPIMIATPPASETSDLWIRHRGTSICLKSIDEQGAQHELKWIYEKPDDWRWTKFGSFSKQQLGAKVIFMRGTEAKPNAGVDLIAFTEKGIKPEGFDPVKFIASGATEENAAISTAPKVEIPEDSIEARIDIDWTKETYKTTRDMFSVACFAAFNPSVSGDPAYQKGMEYMNPGLLRYHNIAAAESSAKNPSGWINFETKSWDKTKIKAALENYSPAYARRMINISGWPSWMDKDNDHFLDKDQYKAFAEFCADLVKITNVELKKNIEYFEVTNELDALFWIDPRKNNQPVRTDDLAEIYVEAARAIKKVDPKVKVGGPAVMRSDLVEDMRQFVKKAGSDLDFFSFHAYCSGTLSESDVSIYDKANVIGMFIRNIRKMLDEESPKRHIEAHLNEYNISWTWETREPRMVNNKSAVFDSLVFLQAASNGLDVGNAWNECDNIYGKMSGEFQLRPSAHAFHYFNSWMIGTAVANTSDHPSQVVSGVVKTSAGRTIVLINRSGATNKAVIKFRGGDIPSQSTIQTAQITDQGLKTGTQGSDSLNDPITLSPHSVNFFQIPLP